MNMRAQTMASPTWLAVRGRELGDAPLLPHQALVPLAAASALRLSQLQGVRLRFGGAAGPVVRLESVVDRSAEVRAAAVEGCAVLVHPWVLEHLQVLDGHQAAVEADAEAAGDARQAPARVVVSVQAKYAMSAGTAAGSSLVSHSATRREGDARQAERVVSRPTLLPESARKGNVSVERAIARQLKAAFGSWSALQFGELVPIRILGELFVVRVEALHGHVDSGVCPTIEVVGLSAASVDESSSASHSGLPAESSFGNMLKLRLEEVGFAGYDSVVTDVLMHLALVLNNDSRISTDAIDYREIGSHGIVLSGVHGVGKSLALKAIEKELAHESITTWRLDGISLIMDFENSKKASAYSYISEKIEQLQSSFPQGLEKAGSSSARIVIIIDDLDALFQSLDGQAADEDTQTHHLPPLGSALLRVLEDIATKQMSVAILGASTKAEVNIPASARRSGRFGKILELIVPTEAMRRNILLVHLRQLQLLQSRDDISGTEEVAQDFAVRLAALTGGYVAKDLVRICRNSVIAAFSRTLIAGVNEEAPVVWVDLLTAQQQIKPSQLRELNVEAPGVVGGTNFVGYHDVRHQLFEFVAWKFQPSAAVQVPQHFFHTL